jgi:hypothetical protein
MAPCEDEEKRTGIEHLEFLSGEHFEEIYHRMEANPFQWTIHPIKEMFGHRMYKISDGKKELKFRETSDLM